MNIHRLYVWLSVFVLAAGAVWAQDAPRIRHFSPSDYGGQNQNWALTQSEEGWMYVGNNAGLLEFDGARWRLFSMPQKQTVRAAAIGRNGEVFCGGYGEFGFWRKTGRDSQWVYHSLSKTLTDEQVGQEEIWHIVVGPDFVLFQSFSILYKYDYRQVTVLRPPYAIMFAHLATGRLLLPVIGGGIYELSPDNTFRFIPGTEVLANKTVQFIVPGPANCLWIGTSSHGLYELRGNLVKPYAGPLNRLFETYQLNRGVRLHDGGWALGTILNGVYILDSLGRPRFHLNQENGLQNNTVLAMREDREGNLWLGLDRGIDLIALSAPVQFFLDHGGLIGTVYTAAEYGNRLYVGTNRGVFVRDMCPDAYPCQAPFRLVTGSQGQVWELRVFDGYLLCGHNDGTLLIEGARARMISEVTGGWCTLPVPGRPDLLLQSTYTGLVVLRRVPNGWVFSHRLEGFSTPLRAIAFDRRGVLWGAHLKRGLYRLELDAPLQQVRAYKAFFEADGLPADLLLSLSVIQDEIVVNSPAGPLHIADSAGLTNFVVVPGGKAGERRRPGFDDQYFSIDSAGVYILPDMPGSPLYLDLVPEYENIVLLPDETYLFCLENGFARLRRSDVGLLTRRRPTSPVIRFMLTPSGHAYDRSGTPELAYRDNSVLFQVGMPFYERSPRFTWKLDGFSARWSPWQPGYEKEFTNLPPGQYTLRVRANVGGAETSVSFRILPPWYQTIWAWLVYALLGFGLLGLLEKINQRRLTRERIRLEAEKSRELERQRAEAERERLALEVENKSRELSNAALNLIRKNEVLQRLKNDLQSADNTPRSLRQLVRQIDEHLEGDHDWEIFEETFNRVHDDFFKKLLQRCPDLTPGDLRLAAYLKMNLATKEIASLLNITVRGVENKRYRLRKKLGLPEEANLTEFMINF